jgi:hypothetical protein
MAYISTQKTAEIRSKLKAEFPEIKFSVSKSTGGHSLRVSIMEAPYHFLSTEVVPQLSSDPYTKYCGDINHYQLDYKTSWYDNIDILRRIVAICMEGNWDRSDVMTDYFDVGWYLDLSIGKWDKMFVYNPKRISKANPRNTVSTEMIQEQV